MLLPKSLGKTQNAAELVEETLSMSDPYGVPLLQIRPDEFAQDALHKIGTALHDIDPDLVDPQKADLHKTAAALKCLLRDGALKSAPAAQSVAARCLTAIERRESNAPALRADASQNTKSHFLAAPEAPSPAAPQHPAAHPAVHPAAPSKCGL